jgi:hypothetical protein
MIFIDADADRIRLVNLMRMRIWIQVPFGCESPDPTYHFVPLMRIRILTFS